MQFVELSWFGHGEGVGENRFVTRLHK